MTSSPENSDDAPRMDKTVVRRFGSAVVPARYANIFSTTLPRTSVRRKSRPE